MTTPSSWRLAWWCTWWLVFSVSALPEPGKVELHINNSVQYDAFVKNVYGNTKVFLKVTKCEPLDTQTANVSIGWMLRDTQCWNEYNFLWTESLETFQTFYNNPGLAFAVEGNNTHYYKPNPIKSVCSGEPIFLPTENTTVLGAVSANISASQSSAVRSPQYTIKHSGDYLLVVHMSSAFGTKFKADVSIEILGPHGYLSEVDFPLLPFYGVMCAVYIFLGIIWLVLCARHWRDLLRIQFWIGGVIFLGMLEKAMFLAEYENINTTGTPTRGLILAADIVSCAKRSLARMLVVIVSLGFGIVKPRLGPTLHRVSCIGFVYFVLAAAESYVRNTKAKNDTSSAAMLATIPLAVIDSSLCWWIFSALVQTTRTLRLRRNVVKLTLYRHFTNTLIFSVIASVLFMLWSIKTHQLEDCLSDWRDLWVDEAFWHLLFSAILCVIMFLWRPSQNNQRYAFMPLLDHEDDEVSDGEDDPFFKGRVTQRSVGRKTSRESPAKDSMEEDPMKWIEENIPESENPLPVLDSEEEIETSKFEVSKMQ